jgi:hypothetical protein
LAEIPGFHDVPDVLDSVYIEHDQVNGPFGAKGVGEVSTFCLSPAIANAMDDAVGVRNYRDASESRNCLSGVSPQAGQAAGKRIMRDPDRGLTTPHSIGPL